MPARSVPPVSAAERRRFEAMRDAATLQLLFKAARLANEVALSRVARAPAGPRVRAAHTALFPHLNFEGIRLTDLAAKVGVTKQAVSPLVDDLAELGMVERVKDPDDSRAKRIRFSHRGHAALMHGLGVLVEIQEVLGATVGARRMRELHETLKRVIAALESGRGAAFSVTSANIPTSRPTLPNRARNRSAGLN
jgi:DNA-binding MarR family transcriptional regulator